MVYFVQAIDGGPVKIGYSEDVTTRVKQLESHYGRPLTVLHVMDGDREAEKAIHRRFDHLRIRRTEQFQPAPDLMAFINRPLFVNAMPVEELEVNPDVKPLVVGIRAYPEWKQWLDELAEHDNRSIVDLISHTLKKYAREIGFREPPKR
jgi:hypothetical protein